MLSQLTQIKSDPLDVLLFAVGLRLTQLAKMGDDKFKGLLENRNFTIQLGSDAEQTSRYYEINNGTFSQHAGPAITKSQNLLCQKYLSHLNLWLNKQNP